MPDGALPSEADREALAAFFFWSSWSAATDHPGEKGLSYTSNGPYEPLVGNAMTDGSAIWTVVSVILLIAGVAAMLWWHSAHPEGERPTPPASDPLLKVKPTPSMKATRKYFFVVIRLILVQIAMGAITAHYAVEGRSFFGLPLAQLLPYTVSRSIHTQFGVFWIATAARDGAIIAPPAGGRGAETSEARCRCPVLRVAGDRRGLNGLRVAGVARARGVSLRLLAQGLEYTNMGRVWQILLFVGLLFWLFLLGRALWPAIKRPSESRGPISMVFLSAACIGAFYATALTWGQNTHYSMIEYWRWWLVHLWVEGFFEVFATAVVALIFTRLGLVAAASANRASIRAEDGSAFALSAQGLTILVSALVQ